MNKYTIDFTECKYILQIHKAIKHGLDFPDYYGENWSALWDCLFDMGNDELCIEIIGLDKLHKEFHDDINIMLELMSDYRKKYNPHLVIKIIYADEEFYYE